jgi:prephenate dehydrogenase
MGGSLALALRGKTAGIGVVDTNPAVCAEALARGIADWAGGDLALASKADVVVLAAPVRVLIRHIGELGSQRSLLKPGALVIDLGSVKRPVVAAMNALPDGIGAVGGHPMCGKEVSGLTYADPDLYRGAQFVLCRTVRTTHHAWVAVRGIVEALGAHPLEMAPDHHDQVVAAISHLPYILASALALCAGVRAADDPDIWRLAATGFQDTSRLAGSDPEMMADVLLENAPAVLAALDGAVGLLDQLRTWVRDGDADRLRESLGAAQAARKDWEQSRKLG